MKRLGHLSLFFFLISLVCFGDEGATTQVRDETKITIKKLTNLQVALFNLEFDIGSFTHIIASKSTDEIPVILNQIFGDKEENNILVSDFPIKFLSSNFNVRQKWLGPYCDSDPKDFMYDSWGQRIKIDFYKGRTFLHSSGPDKIFDDVSKLDDGNSLADDLIVRYKPLK